jgi:hypothetical protein
MLLQVSLYIKHLLAIIPILTNYRYSDVRQFYIKSRLNIRRLLSLILRMEPGFSLGWKEIAFGRC